MERELVFSNTAAAAVFLRRFAQDPMAVRGLQFVLARLGAEGPGHELADQWVERLALHLASGRVTVVEQVPRAAARESVEGSSSAPAPMAPVPRRTQVAKAVEVPDSPTFSTHDADEPAQAKSLVEAARNGTPFCEVCAKTAAAKALSNA